MTDARAIVALGTLHAIARQVTYPSAREARLLVIPTAETAVSASTTSTTTSSTAIRSARSTARCLGARTRNMANLATAIAFCSCAASTAATAESASPGLGLGTIARDVAFPPTAIAGFRFLFHRTVPRYVALHAAVIAGRCARLGAVCGLVSESTAVKTSSCASHAFSFFFNKTFVGIVSVCTRQGHPQSTSKDLNRNLGLSGVRWWWFEEKRESPRCGRFVSHALDTWWRWLIASFGNSVWPQ